MGIDIIFTPMFFHHRMFYNGEQIFLNKNNIETLKLILKDYHFNEEDDIANLSNFQTLRKVLGSLINKDSFFLCGDEEVNKNEENQFSILRSIENEDKDKILINIYNKNFCFENKINPSFNFSELKEIEKNEKFSILEYPEKKAEDYSSIVIFGSYKEQNIAFINGFLNFLFDINENSAYRLKLVSNDNKDEDEENFGLSITIRYICSEKGNFKFICINQVTNFDENDFKKFSEYLKKEKYINLFLFNQVMLREFEFNNSDILQKILNSNESDKYACFFVCPYNSLQLHLKVLYLQENMKFKDKVELIRYMVDKGFINEELIKETIIQAAENDERLREQLISCSLDYESIYYENKNNKNNSFLYIITMKGYSYFYNIVTDRKKNNIFVDISLFIDDNFTDFLALYKYNIIKQEKIEMIKLEKKIEQEKNKIINLENYDDELENIKNNIINKKNNLSLFVPNNSIKKKINNKRKTMVCNICKFNCHENCIDFKKINCKSFKQNLSDYKCTKCPNKCSIENHEIVDYKYENEEYKTIKEILEGNFEFEKFQKNYDSMKSKIEEYESKLGKDDLIFLENQNFNKQNLKWYQIILLEILDYKEPSFNFNFGPNCQIF